jgi:hypothetical protein
MFLPFLLILAMAGFAIYTVVHGRAQPATGIVGEPAAVPVPRAPFWPTTLEGKVGVGAFALNFLLMALVNVAFVPFLSPVALLAALVLTGVARFAKHDHSASVLIAFAVSAFAALALLLFLAGEVFIGHD